MDVAELLEFPLEDLLDGDEETLKETLTEVFDALQQTHEDYEKALQGGRARGELLRQNAELQTEVEELTQELADLKSSGSGNSSSRVGVAGSGKSSSRVSVAELLEFPLKDLLECDEDTLKDTLTEVFTALQQTHDDHDNALQGGGALQKNLTTGLDRDQLLKLHDFVAQLKDGKAMDDSVVLDDQNMEVQLKFDEIKAKSRKIEALEQRLQQERDRTELVRTQHDETMEQLAEEQREKAEVEHWNTRLREVLAKAEKTLTRRNNDIQSLKDKLDVGMEELAKVGEKLVDLEDNFNEQLESRFQAKSQQLDALKQRLREERDRTELVRSQHGDTTEQLAGANQMFSSQIELNDILGETVRRLKVDLLGMDTTQYGDKGIKLLAPALVKMTKLKMLWLNDNNIGDDGIALLCHALPHMKALHTLGLENNKIGDGGCKSILGLFKNGSLPSLEWLYLDGNSNISSQTKSEFTREWKAKGKKGGCCLLI